MALPSRDHPRLVADSRSRHRHGRRHPPASGKFLLLLATVAVLAALLFLPAIRNGFVLFDDDVYVTDNYHVRTGVTSDNVLWALRTFHGSNWHPLTWLSHQADAGIFGMNPSGHHLTSVLLHVANTCLLAVLLRSMTGALFPPLAVALLFAVHPLRVESVAWVSERKDVLSGLFFMLTLLAWTRYVRNETRGHDPISSTSELGIVSRETRGHDPISSTSEIGIVSVETRGHDPISSSSELGIVSVETRGHDPISSSSELGIVSPRTQLNRWYFLSLAFFALGLMAKPMLVTVPFLLLLLDWWPLGRIRSPGSPWRLLGEKVPFFVLSAGSAVVTVVAQRSGGALGSLGNLPLGQRLANGADAAAGYLLKTAWPFGLSVFYLHPLGTLSVWRPLAAVAVLVAVSFAVVRWRKYAPALMLGWWWFVLALGPVIGIVQVGAQSMADRYTYLPHIGLFVAVTALGWRISGAGAPGRIISRSSARLLAAGAVLATVAGMAAVTSRQIGVWRSSVSLFEHAAAVTPDNPLVALNLAVILGKSGQYEEAEAAYRNVLRLEPDWDEARYLHGILAVTTGDRLLAITEYERLRSLNEVKAERLGRFIAAAGWRLDP